MLAQCTSVISPLFMKGHCSLYLVTVDFSVTIEIYLFLVCRDFLTVALDSTLVWSLLLVLACTGVTTSVTRRNVVAVKINWLITKSLI